MPSVVLVLNRLDLVKLRYPSLCYFAKKAVDVAWFTYGDDMHARSHLVLVKSYLALGELEAATPHLVDAQALVNFTDKKDWKLVVEVEQLRADHMKAGGLEADTVEIERRLATIREILG